MSIKPTILVQHRIIYGKALTYPVNALAQIAAELLGKKTFSDRDLLILGKMGLVVSWVLQGEQAPEPEGRGVLKQAGVQDEK